MLSLILITMVSNLLTVFGPASNNLHHIDVIPARDLKRIAQHEEYKQTYRWVTKIILASFYN